MTRASLHRGWLNNLDAHFAPRDEQLSSYERVTRPRFHPSRMTFRGPVRAKMSGKQELMSRRLPTDAGRLII
jgi:hypothetical protein